MRRSSGQTDDVKQFSDCRHGTTDVWEAVMRQQRMSDGLCGRQSRIEGRDRVLKNDLYVSPRRAQGTSPHRCKVLTLEQNFPTGRVIEGKN